MFTQGILSSRNNAAFMWTILFNNPLNNFMDWHSTAIRISRCSSESLSHSDTKLLSGEVKIKSWKEKRAMVTALFSDIRARNGGGDREKVAEIGFIYYVFILEKQARIY